jgi:hypothetical protein
MNLSLAFLLALLLSLAVACGSNDDPPVTPEPPGSESTPQPRSTPTPRPSPTPGAGTSATPQTEDRSDGLTFHFGPGVDSFDRSLIVRAVEVVRQLLRDESGVQPPAAVFASESPAELARAFEKEALAQAWRADGMHIRLSQTIAEASYRGIVINTGMQGWKDMDATERLRVVAHEFVHVIQLEHAGLEIADATFSGPNTSMPPAGPFWLLEGSAEVVSWLVLQELGLGSYTAALTAYAKEAGPKPAALTGMEDFFGFTQAGRPGLGTSVLAVEYLLRSRTLDDLFALWTELRRNTPWTTAFTRLLGVPPTFFYSSFEDYYESTWARLIN